MPPQIKSVAFIYLLLILLILLLFNVNLINLVWFDLILGMQVLVDAREKLEIPWEHPNTQLAANQAILFHSGNGLDIETFHQYAPTIHHLWQDRAIKKAYDRRREFQLVSI